MKKLLLLITLFVASQMNAQVLQSEDFNALTLGDVGTDITGATAGQGGWFTFATNGTAPTTGTNAGNSNFQIVTTGNTATQGLKIVGSDGNKGSRFMWKDGLAAAWGTRTSGNEIIEIEYDLYTGGTTTSKGQYGVRLYGLDGTTSRVLNGFVFNVDTKVLQGVCYLNNAGTLGTYLITLGAAPLTLLPDTWYRIGFAYDTTTGETIWKADTAYTGLPAANWTGPFAVDEVDFVGGTPAANTAVSDLTFDNLTVKATAVEALLDVNVANQTSNFNVYPNPTTSIVNINNTLDSTISSVEFTDINGRVLKSVTPNTATAQINISDLAQGVYMVKITSDKGTAVKKIVKE